MLSINHNPACRNLSFKQVNESKNLMSDQKFAKGKAAYQKAKHALEVMTDGLVLSINAEDKNDNLTQFLGSNDTKRLGITVKKGLLGSSHSGVLPLTQCKTCPIMGQKLEDSDYRDITAEDILNMSDSLINDALKGDTKKILAYQDRLSKVKSDNSWILNPESVGVQA